MTNRRFEGKSPLLVIIFAFVKPASCSSEPQAPRPVLLDSERREIERKQLEELYDRRLEEWDRTLRYMNRPPAPGASTVDVEELRIPKKARNQRYAEWLELRKNKLVRADLLRYPDPAARQGDAIEGASAVEGRRAAAGVVKDDAAAPGLAVAALPGGEVAAHLQGGLKHDWGDVFVRTGEITIPVPVNMVAVGRGDH